ncbi:MAG: carbohydrate kinase family protein [bacterium]|nr:carbohydrate kinase family protein [bacterium]
MYDIITIGAATRDLFITSRKFKTKRDDTSPTDVDLVLPLGSKINLDSIIFETGGGATNAAVTFARQGLKTACITRVGDDPGGKATVESLAAEGVDTGLVIKDKQNYTAYSIILVTATGERTILVYRGASSHFNDEMLPKSKLDTKWVFISSLAGNVSLLSGLVNWADKHGLKTALVPGSSELARGKKVLAPIFSKSDVVIMNREEAALLTAIPFDKKEKIVHKMCLISRGISVITDARNGATVCDREFVYHVGTHGNPAVDRTGSGDAFASGFVAGLIRFQNVEGALELAADNASNVVNFFGAKQGILHAGQKPFKEKLKVTKSPIKRKTLVYT